VANLGTRCSGSRRPPGDGLGGFAHVQRWVAISKTPRAPRPEVAGYRWLSELLESKNKANLQDVLRIRLEQDY